MNAARWILFGLVAFALGTGAAYAIHPPTTEISAAKRDAIGNALTKAEGYAAEGRCDAVKGRINSAQVTVNSLSSKVSPSTKAALRRSIEDARAAAYAQCQSVYAANRAKAEEEKQKQLDQALQDAIPSTPVEPSTPTDGGTDGGGPDPGTGEGDGSTSPGGTETTPADGSTGGAAIPEGAAELRDQLQRQQKKLKDNLRQGIDKVLNGQ